MNSYLWKLEGVVLSLCLVRIFLYTVICLFAARLGGALASILAWFCIGKVVPSITQNSLAIVVKLKISYLSKTYLFKEQISIKSNFLELKFRSISCDLWTILDFQSSKASKVYCASALELLLCVCVIHVYWLSQHFR